MNNKTVIKFKEAPQTVKEAKLNIFAPYEKKNTEELNAVVYESDLFLVELDGYKLNQIHRDILDIATYYGDNTLDGKTKDIKPVRLFSLYDIQKHLSYKSKSQNTWVDQKFREMQKSLIKITNKQDGSWQRFNIIDLAEYSQKQNRYAIVFSEKFTLFFENEISVGYKEYLSIILKMNAQSRAIARYVLSHSNSFSISLDNLMEKVGIDKKKTIQNWRKLRNNILKDKELFDQIGITFTKKTGNPKKKDDYILNYTLLPKISIYHPLKNKLSET